MSNWCDTGCQPQPPPKISITLCKNSICFLFYNCFKMFVFTKQTKPRYLTFRLKSLFDPRELIRCQMKLTEGEITDYKLGFKQTERERAVHNSKQTKYNLVSFSCTYSHDAG